MKFTNYYLCSKQQQNSLFENTSGLTGHGMKAKQPKPVVPVALTNSRSDNAKLYILYNIYIYHFVMKYNFT